MTKEYAWVARYNNNDVVYQFEKDKKNNFLELDRKNLRAFTLCEYSNLSYTPRITISLEPGQRLIFRRRVILKAADNSTRGMYLIGWQQNVNGKNIQSILCMDEETGFIEQIGKWDESGLKKEPVFHERELICISYSDN